MMNKSFMHDAGSVLNENAPLVYPIAGLQVWTGTLTLISLCLSLCTFVTIYGTCCYLSHKILAEKCMSSEPSPNQEDGQSITHHPGNPFEVFLVLKI